MANFLTCKCGESDDKKTKTGARIDGVYFCEGCYGAAMDKMETEVMAEVFGSSKTNKKKKLKKHSRKLDVKLV